MAEVPLTCERSCERCTRVYESFTRDHECLRVLGGLSEAGYAGFIGIFGMAGVPLAQVRSYERLRALYDRSREIAAGLLSVREGHPAISV